MAGRPSKAQFQVLPADEQPSGINSIDAIPLARKCGYPADPAQLVDAVIAQTPAVIAQVASELPPGFPQALAAQMLDGLALGARSLLAVA
jgi:hypothetical protein